MTYRVEIVPRAEREIAGNYHYIAQRAPQAALRWLNGIYLAIRSLATQRNDSHLQLCGRNSLTKSAKCCMAAAATAVRHAARDALNPNDF